MNTGEMNEMNDVAADQFIKWRFHRLFVYVFCLNYAGFFYQDMLSAGISMLHQSFTELGHIPDKIHALYRVFHVSCMITKRHISAPKAVRD